MVDDTAVRTGTVTRFLDRLAARTPTSAGGSVARAGSAMARMNVESNVRSSPDSEGRSRLLRRMGVAKGRT